MKEDMKEEKWKHTCMKELYQSSQGERSESTQSQTRLKLKMKGKKVKK